MALGPRFASGLARKHLVCVRGFEFGRLLADCGRLGQVAVATAVDIFRAQVFASRARQLSCLALVDRLGVVDKLAHLLRAAARLGYFGGPLMSFLRVIDFDHREPA